MIPTPDLSTFYDLDAVIRRKQIARDLALSWVLCVIEAERKAMEVAAIGGRSINHYRACEKALSNIFMAAEEYERNAKELRG